jgi:hypothetical protein
VFLVRYNPNLYILFRRICVFNGLNHVGQSDHEAGFLQVLRVPLSVLIPPTALHSLIILSSTLYNVDDK